MSSSAPGASPTNIRSAFGIADAEHDLRAARACAACSACSRRCRRGSRSSASAGVGIDEWHVDCGRATCGPTCSARRAWRGCFGPTGGSASGDARVRASPSPRRVAADAGHAELLIEPEVLCERRGDSRIRCESARDALERAARRDRGSRAASAVFGPSGQRFFAVRDR